MTKQSLDMYSERKSSSSFDELLCAPKCLGNWKYEASPFYNKCGNSGEKLISGLQRLFLTAEEIKWLVIYPKV